MRTGIFMILCGLVLDIAPKYGYHVELSTIIGMIISMIACTLQDLKEILK